MVAAENRPVVRKLPLAEPQRPRTGFLTAASERDDPHAAKSPPASVIVVGPSLSWDTVNCAGRLAAARPTEARWRAVGCVAEKLPVLPSAAVNVMTPFVTSTVSPELSTKSWSAGREPPLTRIVPVPIALKVPGCAGGGGGGGGVPSSRTVAAAEVELFAGFVSKAPVTDVAPAIEPACVSL